MQSQLSGGYFNTSKVRQLLYCFLNVSDRTSAAKRVIAYIFVEIRRIHSQNSTKTTSFFTERHIVFIVTKSPFMPLTLSTERTIYDCGKIKMNPNDRLLLVSLNKSFDDTKANGVYRRISVYEKTHRYWAIAKITCHSNKLHRRSISWNCTDFINMLRSCFELFV